MKIFKKMIAVALSITACLTVSPQLYNEKPVLALDPIPIEMEASVEKEVISIGESTVIKTTLLNPDLWTSYNPNIQFGSSDESVATVSSDGVVTGIGVGTAEIILSSEYYSKICAVEITVVSSAYVAAQENYSYEIIDGSIHFSCEKTSNVLISYVISSNLDYDMTCKNENAVFTPNENGRYVLTVEEYKEEIIDVNDNHFHYFYPILHHYKVDVVNDKITVQPEFIYSYYSEEQIQEEIDNQGAVEDLGCYDVYAEGTRDDMFALDGNYFSFVNGSLPNETSEIFPSYITTVYNKYHTESYFCLNTHYRDPDILPDAPVISFSDETLAEVTKKMHTSSNTSTDDIMDFYMIKAIKDGTLSIYTCLTELPNEYKLTIKNGIFHRTNKSVPNNIKGDVNADEEFNIADIVLFQKWLLAIPDVELQNWRAADLCQDDRLNMFDMVMMKRELITKLTPDEPQTILTEDDVWIFSYKCGYMSIDQKPVIRTPLLIDTQEQLDFAKIRYGLDYPLDYNEKDYWFYDSSFVEYVSEMEKQYPIEEYSYLIKYDEVTSGGYYLHADKVSIKGDSIDFELDDESYTPSPYEPTTCVMGGFMHMAAIPKKYTDGIVYKNVVYPDANDPEQQLDSN